MCICVHVYKRPVGCKIENVVGFSWPAEGERLGVGASAHPHPLPLFENCKELLRKRCFQPRHFESLVSLPIFKVAPRSLSLSASKLNTDTDLACSVDVTFNKYLNIIHKCGKYSNHCICLNYCLQEKNEICLFVV